MKRIIALSLLLCCLAGCRNDNPQGRVPVRGRITLGGEALTEGNIEFASLPEIRPGVATGGVIRQGDYSIPASHGLISGQEYRVRIRSVREVPGTRVEADDPMKVKVEYRDVIPPDYGSASTKTVTATEKSPNVFDFEIVVK